MEKKLILFAVALIAVSAQINPDDRFGRCTMKKFTDRQGQCTRKFMMAIRTNRNASCSKEFDRSLACMKKWIRICLRGAVPPYVVDATEQGATQSEAVNSIREIYCGDKDIELPMPEIAINNGTCDDDFLPTLKTYMKNFFKTFRRDRSNPKLCDEYKEMQKNMTTLVETKCKSIDVDSVVLALDDKFSPFCP